MHLGYTPAVVVERQVSKQLIHNRIKDDTSQGAMVPPSDDNFDSPNIVFGLLVEDEAANNLEVGVNYGANSFA